MDFRFRTFPAHDWQARFTYQFMFYLSLYRCLTYGIEESASHQGDVRLGPNFTLKDILFIHNLKCNLLSLGQMETDYFITFLMVFVLQDLISRTPIGVGEWMNGIFIYRLLRLSNLFACSTSLLILIICGMLVRSFVTFCLE